MKLQLKFLSRLTASGRLRADQLHLSSSSSLAQPSQHQHQKKFAIRTSGHASNLAITRFFDEALRRTLFHLVARRRRQTSGASTVFLFPSAEFLQPCPSFDQNPASSLCEGFLLLQNKTHYISLHSKKTTVQKP